MHRHHDDVRPAHGHVGADAGAPEGTWAPSHPGSVALDIGGEVGALVLLVPGDLAGHEIEASRTGAGLHGADGGPHTAVRERVLPGGSVQAAVFPSLEAGDYRLALKGERAGRAPVAFPEVHVAAGRVTEVDVTRRGLHVAAGDSEGEGGPARLTRG